MSADIPDAIMARTCVATGLNRAQIIGGRQSQPYCRARYAFMVVMDRQGASLTTTARELGNRHYSTIIHGLRQAERLSAADPTFAALCAAVEGR